MHPRIRADCVAGQKAAESSSNLVLNNVIIVHIYYFINISLWIKNNVITTIKQFAEKRALGKCLYISRTAALWK
jgi:hypothetical protein